MTDPPSSSWPPRRIELHEAIVDVSVVSFVLLVAQTETIFIIVLLVVAVEKMRQQQTIFRRPSAEKEVRKMQVLYH